MPELYRILLSKRAANELGEIHAHISKDSPQNADLMIERILQSILGLEIFPHRNVVEGQYPNLKTPVRSLPVQSYLIFFRVIDHARTVRILRIRHGAMRRPRKFD